MWADYHLHSEFSDDSNTPMEAQIERAIDLGIDELCFTDHVDYGIKEDWDSDKPLIIRNGNITANVNYPEYLAKLLRMQRTYVGRITIKKGFEFGVQQHTIPFYNKLYEKYKDDIDFTLLAIHEVEDKEFWDQAFQAGRTQEEYNMRYYEEMIEVMKNFDHYCVLAHVDLIARYDEAGLYPFEKIKPTIEEIFDYVISHDKGIEINTSSWRYGLTDTTPSRDILKLYKAMGGRILTMGSDAHRPEYLGHHFKDARDILRDELGFKEFCTFEKFQPIFHKL